MEMQYQSCTHICVAATHSSLLTPEITHKIVGHGWTFQSSRRHFFIEVSKLLFQNPWHWRTRENKIVTRRPQCRASAVVYPEYQNCLYEVLACVAPLRRRNAQFLGTELRPRLYKIDSPNVGLLYGSPAFWLQCGDMITKAIYLYKFRLIYVRLLQYPYSTRCTLLVSSVM